MRPNETGVAAMETKVGALIDLFLLAAAKAENDFVFLGNNFCEIDADVRCVDAPARGVSRVVSDLRAVNHRLGGRATNVDAGSTQVLVLDERYIPSQIRKAIRETIAAMAGAHYDRVVLPNEPPTT